MSLTWKLNVIIFVGGKIRENSWKGLKGLQGEIGDSLLSTKLC